MLRRMAEVVWNAMSGSESGKDLEEQCRSLKKKLLECVETGEDAVKVIQSLIDVDHSVFSKYEQFDACEILQRNNQSLEDLKGITSAVSLIIKYARYLIKPVEKRIDKWSLIHFNNSLVQRKMIRLQGYELVLAQLGYTESLPQGLSFPEGKEPHRPGVLNMIAELMIFRKEIKDFILGVHPHSQAIDDLVPQCTRDQLSTMRLTGAKYEEEENLDTVAASICQAEDGSHLLVPHDIPSLAKLRGASTDSKGSSDSTETVFKSTSPATSFDENPSSCTVKEQVSTEAIQDLVVETETPENMGNSSGGGQTSSSSLRIACDVCGEDAIVFCRECSNKPLCDGCNQTWHKHRLRRGHQLEKISVLANLSLESGDFVHMEGPYGITAQPTQDIGLLRKQQTSVVKSLHKQKSALANAGAAASTVTGHMIPQDITSGLQAHQVLNNHPVPTDAQLLEYQRQQSERFSQNRMHQEHSQLQHQQHFGTTASSSFHPVPAQTPQGQAYGTQGHGGVDTGSYMHMGLGFAPVAQRNLPQSHQSGPQEQQFRQPLLPYYTQQQQHSQHHPDAWTMHGASSLSPTTHPGSIYLGQRAHQEQLYVNPQLSIRPAGPVQSSNPAQHSVNSVVSQQTYSNYTAGTPGVYSRMQSQLMPSLSTPQTAYANSPYRSSLNLSEINREAGTHSEIQQSPSVSFQTNVAQGPTKLLSRIMQEPNLSKRMQKCLYKIEEINDDIKEMEVQINSYLMSQEDYQNEPFLSMLRNKASMMREIQGLTAYYNEMQKDMNHVSAAPPSGKEEAQKIYLPQELNTMKQGMPSVNSQSTFNAAFYSTANSNTNNSSSIQNVPAKQSVVKSATAHRVEDKSNHSPRIQTLEINSGQMTNSLTGSEARTRMNTESVRRVPEENLDEQIPTDQPPALPLRSKPSDNMLNTVVPPPRPMKPPTRPTSKPVPLSQPWHCEHCTFINPAGSHACAICHKTSDNPQLVEVGAGEPQGLMEPDQDFIELLQEIQAEQRAAGRESEELKRNENVLEAGREAIGLRIADTQDQVMLEKKKAHKEYEMRQQQNKAGEPVMTFQQDVLAAQNSSTPAKSKTPSPTPTVDPRLPSGSSPVPQRKGSCSDYYTPPSEVSPSLSRSEGQDMMIIQSRSNLQDALAKLNDSNMIAKMTADGAELIRAVKLADLEGFCADAVEIALTFCHNLGLSPLQWLRANWQKNVNTVITKATNVGFHQEQNEIGEICYTEAEAALIDCSGNVKDAVQRCVKNRKDLYNHLAEIGNFPREEILQTMFQQKGNKKGSEQQLFCSVLQPFVNRIWEERQNGEVDRYALRGMTTSEMCHSFSTSVISHNEFQEMIKNENIDKDRRIRMILVEGKLKSWGRAELVVRIFDKDLRREDVTLEDVVEAVRNCQDRQSALAYLQQECQLCFTDFPMNKIRNLSFCQCKMCEQCLVMNFEVAIKEKFVRHWICPLCSLPDISNHELFSDYLQFLNLLLQPLIDPELMNMFETKVRDWHLHNEAMFRWCAHCAEGFVFENPGQLRMTCPKCKQQTCYKCKRKWEPQHEGLTCEQFSQWKVDNDPANQSVGLAKHLDENGIDCPSCKMRFALAKGGCMHFKCPQCGHEFCSGCYQPYHHKGVCRQYNSCINLGLHCHCPRDCFSFLRDRKVEELQKLLTLNNASFNMDTPQDQVVGDVCPVMEQKEFDSMKKDEKCGKVAEKGQAGLCEIHYKEYLTVLINRNGLDPVIIMPKEELVALLKKYDIKIPHENEGGKAAYRAKLSKIVKENLPLIQK